MGIEQFYTLLIQKIFLDLKGWIAMLKMLRHVWKEHFYIVQLKSKFKKSV